MKEFIVRLDTGEYLYNVEIRSHYEDYEKTTDPAAADRLTDFDSRLVIDRLRKKRQTASREPVSGRTIDGASHNS